MIYDSLWNTFWNFNLDTSTRCQKCGQKVKLGDKIKVKRFGKYAGQTYTHRDEMKCWEYLNNQVWRLECQFNTLRTEIEKGKKVKK